MCDQSPGRQHPAQLPQSIGRDEGYYSYDNQRFTNRLGPKKQQYVNRQQDQSHHGIEDADVESEEGHFLLVIEQPAEVADDRVAHQVDAANDQHGDPDIHLDRSIVMEDPECVIYENTCLEDEYSISHHEQDLAHGVALVTVME